MIKLLQSFCVTRHGMSHCWGKPFQNKYTFTLIVRQADTREGCICCLATPDAQHQDQRGEHKERSNEHDDIVVVSGELDSPAIDVWPNDRREGGEQIV